MSFIRLLLFLFAAFAADAASIPGGREAWQKLLSMPKLQFTFSAGWSTSDGLILSSDKPGPEEIPRLRAQLAGTPADAALHWQMSRIFSRLDDDQNKSNSVARAVALYRRQNETRPENIEVLVNFGLALDADQKSEEAEAVLRRAVRLAQNDWRAWSALAKWHDRRVAAALCTTNSKHFMELLSDKSAKWSLPAGQLEAVVKNAAEANRCADRAVELAPKEPLAYAARVQIRASANFAAHACSVARGNEPDALKAQLSVFATNVLADLWRLSELSPNDPRPLGLIAFGQLVVGTAALTPKDRESIFEGKLLNLLPDSDRRQILRALTRLEELERSLPAAEAALALEIRGVLLCNFLQDYLAAEVSLRRAIELAPGRETSWEMLILLFVNNDRPALARAHAEKHLKIQDNMRNRIIAAKTCEKLGLLTAAQSHVNEALKLEPDGYYPNLAALVLALKRSTDMESAMLATPFLKKLQALPSDTLSNDQRIEANLEVGIACVLVDQPSVARDFFAHVQKIDPENETAKQALAMLAGR